MNVTQTKRTLMGLPPRKSVLLESNHGLGKSDVVRQVAAAMSKKLGKPFQLVDFRLAQCEVADVIGMMRHADVGEVTHIVYKNGKKESETHEVKNVTLHDFAEWFPTDPDSYGYLFLDELPRASRDLQNAVMELALDYRYHFKELPMGWRVIAASNDDMDVYAGAVIDPALYDRFLKIKFKPTVPEWLAYAKEHSVHRAVITYITKIDSDLMPEKVEPGVIAPSPRSWVSLSDIIKYMAKNGDDPLNDLDYLLLLSKGYLGNTVSMNFVDYVKNSYKIYSGKDIIDKMTDELEAEFKTMIVTETTFYNGEVIKYIKKLKKLTEKQSQNLYRYITAIPKESASGFWSTMMAECRELGTAWHKNQAGAKKYIMSLLSKTEAMK